MLIWTFQSLLESSISVCADVPEDENKKQETIVRFIYLKSRSIVCPVLSRFSRRTISYRYIRWIFLLENIERYSRVNNIIISKLNIVDGH